MGAQQGGLLGQSLEGSQGYPQWLDSVVYRILGRIAGAAICVAALASATVAVVAAQGGTVIPGVVAENPGGTVQDVLRGSLGWRDGIRAGQIVLSVTAADEPNGWTIVTQAGEDVFRSGVAAQRRLLEATLPAAYAALLLATSSLVALRRRRRVAEGMAAIALVLASVPVSIQGSGGFSLAIAALAVFIPYYWLRRELPRRAWVPAVCFVGMAVSLLWLAMQVLGHQLVVPIGEVRSAMAFAGGALVAGVLAGSTPPVSVRTLGTLRLIDLACVAALTLLVVALAVASTPPVAIALVVAITAAAYPAFRRAAVRAMDRMLFAELRERMRIQASEAERGKLARELHDAPLQDLAGVIKRLEPLAGAQLAVETLRDVAQQLRDITIELHPPVLDDLGLVPALEFLLSQPAYRASGVSSALQVRDQTRSGRARPPADVELGIFRIMQEASSNAIRHSGAHTITITGDVEAGRIELTLADDGHGIDPGREFRAAREGRLGLSSMRRRAESIGAVLILKSRQGHGTEICVKWEL